MPLKGSKHKDRVLINDPKARSLLMKYTSVSSDRKKLLNQPGITRSEFKSLKASLRKNGFASLVDLLSRLHTTTARVLKCPNEYRVFLSEIARNSPACGLLQPARIYFEEVIAILKKIAESKLDICDSRNSHQLHILQTNAPVIADFLCVCPMISDKLPDEICGIILHIISKQENAYSIPSNPVTSYAAASPTQTSFFPAWPKVRGAAKYAADSNSTPHDLDSCRKTSYGHPSLTPGIFTVYCPHGVCYRYEIMHRCESPRHPFEIFTTHLPVPPHTIIYDNACTLHAYSLNREPYCIFILHKSLTCSNKIGKHLPQFVIPKMAFTTIYQNWHKCVFTTIGTLQTIYTPTYPHANVYQKWHKFVSTGIGIYEYLPELAYKSIYQYWHIRVSTRIGIYEHLPILAYTSIYQNWHIRVSTRIGMYEHLSKMVH